MALVAPTPIPAQPPAPQPTDSRVDFSNKAFAWVGSMEPTRVAFNLLAAQMYENAQYARDQADRAQGLTDDAIQTINQAASGVQVAVDSAQAASNYKGEWSALAGALNKPATVTHLGRLWFLKQNLANVAAQVPALGSAYWGEVSRNDFVIYTAGVGNTSALDRGLYRLTSDTSVLVLPASPWHGMLVGAINVSGTLTPKIDRNGKTICGDAEDYVLNVLGWQIVLQYDAASGDWLRVNGLTAFTPFSTSQPFAQANAWASAQTFTAGAQLGELSPVIKTKWVAGALSAAAAATTTFAHGLAFAKVLCVIGRVETTAGTLSVMPGYNANAGAGNEFGVSFDGTNVIVKATTSNSANVLGKQFRALVIYEA